jgi:hypothetical protein
LVPLSRIGRGVRGEGAPAQAGAEEWMQEPYDEGIANHVDPESCTGRREARVKR